MPFPSGKRFLSLNLPVSVFHNTQDLLKKYLEKEDCFSVTFICCQTATDIQTVLKKNSFNSFPPQSFWQYCVNVKKLQHHLLYFKSVYETLCHRQ